MAYEKHNWANGEVITEDKLNHMENGVGENNMSYEKHTWETGELITADKLNHMEEGIEGGGGSAPTPVLTQKIIIKNSYEGTVYLANYDYIIDGKYVQKGEEQLSPGEYNVVIPIVKSRYEADVFSFYPLAMNHDTNDYGTATNLVNCEADTIYGSDTYLVIDPSQDVSITTTFE